MEIREKPERCGPALRETLAFFFFVVDAGNNFKKKLKNAGPLPELVCKSGLDVPRGCLCLIVSTGTAKHDRSRAGGIARNVETLHEKFWWGIQRIDPHAKGELSSHEFRALELSPTY